LRLLQDWKSGKNIIDVNIILKFFKLKSVDNFTNFENKFATSSCYYNLNFLIHQNHRIASKFSRLNRNEMLVLHFIDYFKDSVSQLFHKCPFPAGALDLMNITLSLNKSTVPIDRLLPKGNYKILLGVIYNNTRTFQMEIQLEIATRLEKW
jgi:hypothetical protein